jgi:ribonuclease HI
MKKYKIYTDGACSGNPGPGGWACIIIDPETLAEVRVHGKAKHTTCNRMELMAAIHALNTFTEPSEITLITDSMYMKDGITSHIERWKGNGWKTSKNYPVVNQDLWMELDKLNNLHKVNWKWTASHQTKTDHEVSVYNNLVDRLAKNAIHSGDKETEYNKN